MLRFAIVPSDLLRFVKKAYRDGFMQSKVRGGIAFQIQALRQKFQLTQAQFAEKTGKTQSVISRLESTEYGKASVQTLLDIASANDVALVVRFVSYPEFLAQTADMSPEALQPQTIFESLNAVPERSEMPNQSDLYSRLGWQRRLENQQPAQPWMATLSGRGPRVQVGSYKTRYAELLS